MAALVAGLVTSTTLSIWSAGVAGSTALRRISWALATSRPSTADLTESVAEVAADLTASVAEVAAELALAAVSLLSLEQPVRAMAAPAASVTTARTGRRRFFCITEVLLGSSQVRLT